MVLETSHVVALAILLLLFMAWRLGGLEWLAAPLFIALSIPVLAREPRNENSSPSKTIGLLAVAALSGAGLLCLIVWALTAWPPIRLPYAISMGAAMSIIALVRRHASQEARPPAITLLSCAGLGWLVGTAPWAAMRTREGLSQSEIIISLSFAAGAIMLATSGAGEPALVRIFGERRVWLTRGLLVGGVAAIGLLPLLR